MVQCTSTCMTVINKWSLEQYDSVLSLYGIEQPIVFTSAECTMLLLYMYIYGESTKRHTNTFILSIIVLYSAQHDVLIRVEFLLLL